MPLTAPRTLGKRGKALWGDVTALHDLSPEQHVTLHEACRTADRLDQLDGVIRGKGVEGLLHLRRMIDSEDGEIVLKVDAVLSQAAAQQTVLKQLLAALRLPDDVTGKRPQVRSARGAYVPGGKPAPVSSLARARAAKSS